MKTIKAMSILVCVLVLFLMACSKAERSDDGGEPEKTGALTYLNRYSNVNISGASSVAVSPDGNHVYVATKYTDAVAWFRRD
jgi:DNA-binding beta-propeller fold protein YncE